MSRMCLWVLLLGSTATAQIYTGTFERRHTALGLPLEVSTSLPEADARLLPALNVQERHPGRMLVLDGAQQPLDLTAAEVRELFPAAGEGSTRETQARCADGRKLRVLRTWHSVPTQVQPDTVWLHHVLRFEAGAVVTDVSTQLGTPQAYQVLGAQRCLAARCPQTTDAELAALWCTALSRP